MKDETNKQNKNMNTTTNILTSDQSAYVQKLQMKYNPSQILNMAMAGDFAGAAELAGKYGLWGLWQDGRKAAGLPADDAARQQLLNEITATRKARFAK